MLAYLTISFGKTISRINKTLKSWPGCMWNVSMFSKVVGYKHILIACKAIFQIIFLWYLGLHPYILLGTVRFTLGVFFFKFLAYINKYGHKKADDFLIITLIKTKKEPSLLFFVALLCLNSLKTFRWWNWSLQF